MVTIEDNGIGRKAAAEINRQQSRKKQSLGMKVTAERIAALPTIERQSAASFVMEDALPQGTRVTLNLPLNLANGNETLPKRV